jgi:hypothetical protein
MQHMSMDCQYSVNYCIWTQTNNNKCVIQSPVAVLSVLFHKRSYVLFVAIIMPHHSVVLSPTSKVDSFTSRSRQKPRILCLFFCLSVSLSLSFSLCLHSVACFYNLIYDMILYICELQLPWHLLAVVQYTFTHKQYTEQHNETGRGDRGSTVVKVLHYKSEGHLFDPRWCHWNFSLT